MHTRQATPSDGAMTPAFLGTLMTHPVPTSVSSPEQPTIDAMTRVIALALQPRRADNEGRLRDALRQLCRDAWRRDLRPEELIVLIKTRWRAHDELSGLTRDEARSTLDHVITTCIEEYYAGGSGR
jgi:hypothetical protein